MIRANDLRIGNIVEQGGIEYIADFITIQMAHNYNPIPLTPEILEKCGFIKTSYSNHKSNPYISQEIRDLDFFDHRFNNMVLSGVGRPIEFYEVEYCPLDIEERTYIAKLNHLHQLQNLYYALTNQELEIKF
jgi:hypothetical protein